jgi:hypothetical protein
MQQGSKSKLQCRFHDVDVTGNKGDPQRGVGTIAGQHKYTRMYKRTNEN